MNIKEELQQIIRDMENTMECMKKSESINEQWAKGAWNALDIIKPKLERLVEKIQEEQ